jgi:hypothetical protein
VTRLAPHLTKPHECLTFWDYVRRFLRKWAGRLLTMSFWLAVGWSIRYMTEASRCPYFLALIGVAAFLMVGVVIIAARLLMGIVGAFRG